MPAFMFLRIYEDIRKSSSMKSVRAAAINVRFRRSAPSAKRLHKCAQHLQFKNKLEV